MSRSIKPVPAIKISNLLILLAFAQAICGLSGFFGRWGWFPELCSHFKMQHFFLGLLGAGFCLALRKKRCAGILLLVALVNGAVSLPFILPITSKTLVNGRPFHVLSFFAGQLHTVSR